MNFVHLRMHSGYSMKDGIIKLDEVLEKAKKDGMGAVALTDLNNVMGAVQFYEAARKTGVKPLLGVDITLENPEQDDRGTKPNQRMTFLIQNEIGYQNANKILSRAYVENHKTDVPLVKREWLDSMAKDGIIALSGATEGRVGDLVVQGRLDEAKAELKALGDLFGKDNFFVELQRDGRLGQENYISAVLPLASELDLPVVATQMNQFLEKEDYDAHDVRVVISEKEQLDNPNRKIRFNREQYFKTQDEMAELFSDIQPALANTGVIASRCNFTLNLGHPELPRFPTEEGETEAQALTRFAKAGLEKRLQVLYPDVEVRESKRAEYEARLAVELGVIENMGFPGYFLIVQDFINWAKDNDIPVGPGRGSGAGSLVAYSLRITDLDPLQYGLLFERFLNPERVSMPDFDIDFCRNRRLEVVEYVRKKFGYNNVSQIATAGTMETRAAIKDVARVMGVLPFVSQDLSNLIPLVANVPVSLKDALEMVPALKEKYENEPDMRKLFDFSMKLEGTPRQFGMHAAGVLIAPREITDFTPLFFEGKEGKGVSSHFDMVDMEKLGLVKFDFLGLDTLTVIKKAEDMIRELPEHKGFDINMIQTDDALAFDTFRRGDTVAVFQFEGDGISKMLSEMKPSCLEDVIAAAALYRPGPLGSGMVSDFISRKNGESVVEYPHACLETILKPTYGVIVYQEQVMQIAQEMAGYSLGGADMLRRAMGKKKPEEMAKQREIFMEGAVKKGIDANTATGVFDLMERFAEYGFNKSHSAAYGWLAYQTAYLKAHFPQQLYAAAMTSKAEDGKFEKVADLVEDARRNGFKILPPDVNSSDYAFKPEGEDGIRFGLSGVKGVGESAALVIQKERENAGTFSEFFEFGARMGKGTINKRVKEALVNAGALDLFGHSRETLMANLESLQDFVNANEKAKASGEESGSAMDELLEQTNEKPVIAIEKPLIVEATENWTLLDRLAREYKVFDFYFSGHPHDAHKQELCGLRGVTPLDEVPPSSQPLYVAGIVTDIFERKAKSSGNPWASITLSDGKTELNVALFGDAYAAAKKVLKVGNFTMFSGRTKDELFQGKVQMTGERAFTKEETRTLVSQYIKIAVDDKPELVEAVVKSLDEAPKGDGLLSSQVLVYKKDENGKPAKSDIGGVYSIQLTDNLMNELVAIAGKDGVRLHPYNEIAPPTLAPRKKFTPRR